jgi:drug/metabolite transporter (DMT)-like permease
MNNIPYFGELLALGAAMAWAIGVILFRKSCETVHPIALNLFKNSLAFVLYPITMILLKVPFFPDVPLMTYIVLISSGVLGMGMADTFYLMSLQRLGAGLLAIITTIYAPTVIILSMIFLDERLTLLQLVGVALIMVAVYIVTKTSKKNKAKRSISKDDLVKGVLFAMISTIVMAFSVILIKPVMGELNLIWATEVRLLGGMIFIGAVLLFHPGRKKIIASLSGKTAYKFMFPGAFVGTYLALLMLLGGLKYALASTATVLNQMSNLFIFILAVLILHEPATKRRLIGIALGFVGAVIVTFGA